MKVVVLASGGLDSTIAAALAKHEGHELFFLTVQYGQRHEIEVERALAVGRALGVSDHRLVRVDLRSIGGSALTGEVPVPKGRSPADRAAGIPITYVPARNSLFLSLAVGYAEMIGAQQIHIGANVVDYSGYPDCRPEFLRAFETVARLGTKAGVEGLGIEICAPLLKRSKAEIVRLGMVLKAPLHLTHSCYDPSPDGTACGRCDSCQIRLAGFESAGFTDPITYAGV